jgi:hypothetical protein
MMTAGAGGTYYFHYIPSEGNRAGGFLHIDDQGHAVNYPPQYLATQVISREWVQPVDALHQLFKTNSDIKDQNGNVLVTAYTVKRPDHLWSILLVNKDPDNDHSVKVVFADPDNKQNRFFSGTVDRVVFGAAEYQWHPDPAPVEQSAPPGRGGPPGHADPDGPPSKSAVTASGADTLYQLPKASIVVLRGKLASD